MSTAWSPMTQLERRTWLLTSGEVVTEPDLEETPSGRKVRIVGTNLSAYASGIDELLSQTAVRIATDKGARVWMPMRNHLLYEEQELGFNPASAKAQLHLIHQPNDRSAVTLAWWRFKHPTLPIEAVLVIRMNPEGYRQPYVQKISGYFVHPETKPHIAYDPLYRREGSNGYADTDGRLQYDERLRFREFKRDNPPSNPLPDALMGDWSHEGERVAAQTLLQRLRLADSLQAFDIPDFREDEPAWLTLELIDTNMNQGLIQDLVDYLDGTPSIDEALRAYQELQNVMRKIGVVLEDRTANDFQAALLTANKAPLQVSLSRPAEEGYQTDNDHSLTMHLPTGTFIVHCARRVNHQEVAERWEEALLVAQLSGQEDTLLAYARKYAEDRGKKRVRSILKERTPKEPA